MKSRIALTLALALLLTNLSAQVQAIQWQRALGGNGWDIAQAVALTSDGGYIAAGQTNSTNGDVTVHIGNTDLWVVKLDATGNVQWDKTFGGSANDHANAIHPTTDGGYVIAGYTGSNDVDVTDNQGWDDFWVVKLDATGLLQWQSTYGGSNVDRAHSIAPAMDGGYIVAGYTVSSDGDVTDHHGNQDYWVVKLDAVGILQWQRTLGGSDLDEANSVAPTADGGYIVAGRSSSADGDVTDDHGSLDYWVVKLDALGTLQWQRTLGGSGHDEANTVAPTADGGYIVAGSALSADGDVTDHHGNFDCWIVKLDASGAIQWHRSLGGSGRDEAYSIVPTTDGGYLFAGFIAFIDGDIGYGHSGHDCWAVQLDATGTIEWERTMGGSGYEEAYSISPTTDAGYIIAGYTLSSDGDVTNNHEGADLWVVKLIDSGVGLDHTGSPDLSFSVFPNPATGSFLVHSDLTHATWVLTDALGRNVFETPQPANTQTLQVSHIPRGLYFVTLRSDQCNHTQRVVLE